MTAPEVAAVVGAGITAQWGLAIAVGKFLKACRVRRDRAFWDGRWQR